jgi:O-antigen/teichoic acid export membrane protein
MYRFLRWSERYTKTDMVYLTKGGSWTMVNRIISTGAGLALTIGFANLLSQDAFGNYKYVLTLASLFSVVSLTGMNAAVTRAVARGYEGTVAAAARMNMQWSIGMILLSLSASAYYFFNDNSLLGGGLLIAAVALPIINSFNLIAPFLKGRKEFKKLVLYQLPRNTIPPLLLLGSLFLTSEPLILIAVYFVSHASIVLGMYLLTRFKHEFTQAVDLSALQFSKHLSVTNILERVSNSLDKILIFHFLGAAPLAIYSFARAPIRELQKTRQFVLTPAFPKLSQRSLPELQRSLPYRTGLMVLVLIPIVIGYILIAPFVYNLLFSQYTESVIYSQVFATSLLLMPAALYIQALTAHLKHRELYAIKTVVPLTQVILLLILIPMFGLWGAFAAIFSAHLVRAAMSLSLFLRAQPSPETDY